MDVHGQLAADDRANADAPAGVGELHRPADVVVVGESERLVAEVGGSGRQFGGFRGAIQKGIG
jgi:hypothetical protein